MKRTVILLVVLFSMALAGQAFAVPLSPTDDAFTVARNPTAVTGGLTYFNIGATAVSGYVRTFIKFDLSSYASIESAKLYLYAYAGGGTAPFSISAFSASNLWSETNLTSSNRTVLFRISYHHSYNYYVECLENIGCNLVGECCCRKSIFFGFDGRIKLPYPILLFR